MTTLQANTGSAQSYVGLLSQVPFLTEVPREDLEPLAQASVVRRYPPGHTVVVQGQFGHSMFVLVSGTLSIRARGEGGGQLELGILEQPGSFFGEVALLGRGVRSATVTAETETVLLEIEKNRFELVARRHESALEGLERYYHARSIATYTRLHRYLGQLPEEAIQAITRGAVMRKFGRNDLVCKSGDPADTVLLIKDGVLKMVRAGADGKLSILAYFNTHDVVGGHDRESRNYDLIALGQAEVIFLRRDAFRALAESHPEVYRRFSKDDMHRQEALAGAAETVFGAAHGLLQEGVEVESLLVINLDRCVRCGNCVRACHARHTFTRLDRRGPIFRRRKAVKSTKHEHLLVPSSCRHCRDPECMIGCPTGAIQRFPDGDVDINDNCIGCDNCARKCPYGNITMRPLSEKELETAREGVTTRAIKCNLCRGYEYSNCVYECPRGAVLRVDPLRYFDELAMLMEGEQIDAIQWQREQAEAAGKLTTKQQVKPRATGFVWASLVFFALACAGILGAYLVSPEPRTGGTTWGLGFGIGSAGCIAFALFLGARKRMPNSDLGSLEVWTQLHMVVGLLGFFAALAHAGFQITGVLTTVLLVVFALEILSGVAGQAIYMVVPRMLTRLERQGLAKLIEDLLEEELELSRGIDEIAHKASPEVKDLLDRRLRSAAAGRWRRLKKDYDPADLVKRIKERAGVSRLSQSSRSTAERLVEDVCRLEDVRTQLALHRALKHWLVFHVAAAASLAVFLAAHIAMMLLVIS